MSVFRIPLLVLVALAPLPALAQEGSLPTMTCAEAMAEDAPLPARHLPAALVGHLALRAGTATIRLDLARPIGAALREACQAPDGAARRIAEIAAAVPPPEGEPVTVDLSSLTCAELVPRWRRDAQVIVPALVAQMAGPEGRIARPAFDRVGEGLPRICRDPANAGRAVRDAAAAIP